MSAAAPGKLVLSGAYAVLSGAPALVTAVDRYVIADTSKPPNFHTPEVREAIGDQTAPWFDASALRDGDRKLGLGSSAAILVASVAALELDKNPNADDSELRALWPACVRAHRRAQGGGSGIDVAASALGGTVRCRMQGEDLDVAPHRLPEGLSVFVYAATSSASTRDMIASVRALQHKAPQDYFRLIAALTEEATVAASTRRLDELLGAMRAQYEGLRELGDLAGAGIVPDGLRAVADRAWTDRVVVMPSGAGGGDMVIAAGEERACRRLTAEIVATGLFPVRASIEARGVHRVGA